MNLSTHLEREAARAHRHPSPAQKEAGNYVKGHVKAHGLDVTIENARGANRTGVDKSSGKPWSVRMANHYGYIKRTEGKDGDHVDVYIGRHLQSPHVFVVNQKDAKTGAFDEHKCFFGFISKAQVERAYRDAFSDGKGGARLGSVTELSVDEFKDWLHGGDTKKPLERATGGRVDKRTHAAVNYVVPSTHAGQRCDGCMHFIPPGACSGVRSPISPRGWCVRYDAKTKRAAGGATPMADGGDPAFALPSDAAPAPVVAPAAAGDASFSLPSDTAPAVPAADSEKPGYLQSAWNEIKNVGADVASQTNAMFNPASDYQTQRMARLKNESFAEGLGEQWQHVKDVGSALVAGPSAPFTAASRAVIAPAWNAVNPLTPEEAAKINTQTAPGVPGGGSPYVSGEEAADTAIQAMSPARGGIRPPVPLTAAPATPPFGVTLSTGEAAGDLAMRQREQSAIRTGNPRAQQFIEQRNTQLDQSRQTVTAQLDPAGQQIVQSPQHAADLITDALTQQEQSRAAGLQQEGARIAANHEALRSSLSPTGTVIASSPLDAANIVSGSVGQAAENAQAATSAAYDTFRQLPGEFHPASFNNVDDEIRASLNRGTNPIKVNPQTTPIAHSAIGDLSEILTGRTEAPVQGGIAQTRDPMTGRVEPMPPLTPQVVESARQRLNAFYGDALNSARSTNNWSDVRAMRGVLNAFDDAVQTRLQDGRFIGGDPQAVVDALQTARGLHSTFRKTFTSQGAGDAVGSAVQQIVGRYEGQAAPPEQIANMLYGKGPLPVKVAGRLTQIFGNTSPEIGAIRQGLMSYITERPPGATAWGPGQVADRIDGFTQGAGRTLTQSYLNPNEIAALRQHAADLRAYDAQLNAPVSPVQSVVNRLTGAGGLPPASTNEAVNQLFRNTLTGSRYSPALVSELQTRLGGTGSPLYSAFKQGLFQHAVQPIDGLADWTPKKVGDNIVTLLNSTRGSSVYSPAERETMQAYVDLMRKITMPAGSYFPSAPPLQNALSFIARRGAAIMGAIVGGHLFPLMPLAGEVTGWVAGSKLEQAIEKMHFNARQQFPLVGEAMAKWQKAYAAAQKANNPVGRASFGFATANLAKAVRPLGIDINALLSGQGTVPAGAQQKQQQQQ